jgi:hypothetical protein
MESRDTYFYVCLVIDTEDGGDKCVASQKIGLLRTTSLRLSLSKGANEVSPSPHLNMETDPVSETLRSLDI